MTNLRIGGYGYNRLMSGAGYLRPGHTDAFFMRRVALCHDASRCDSGNMACYDIFSVSRSL